MYRALFFVTLGIMSSGANDDIFVDKDDSPSSLYSGQDDHPLQQELLPEQQMEEGLVVEVSQTKEPNWRQETNGALLPETTFPEVSAPANEIPIYSVNYSGHKARLFLMREGNVLDLVERPLLQLEELSVY